MGNAGFISSAVYYVGLPGLSERLWVYSLGPCWALGLRAKGQGGVGVQRISALGFGDVGDVGAGSEA